MKTRIKIKNLGLGLVAVFLMLFSVAGFSQTCPTNQITLSIQNMVQTSTTLDYDVVLTNTGPTTMKLSGFAGNVRFPAGMLTTGTLTVLTQPSATGNFPGIANVAPSLVLASQQARWTNTPFAPESSSVDLPSGTPMQFARFRITNTGTPWDNFPAQLYFSTGAPPAGVSLNTVTVYCSGGTNSTPVSLAAGTLVLQNPASITLGETPAVCFTSGVAAPTAPSCLGSADGSVTVTMSPLPSSSSASYSLNGGAAVPVTLTAGAFTISGLVAGTYTLDVTGNGTCTTPVSVPFTIDAGAAPTVNSTSVSACDTYTWANNGQTYTASGTYTGNTTNCITEELVLTITPSSTNTTTASACDTYTWANNGQTYTASGTYTGTTTNCVTEELVLTITPSSTNTTTVAACDTYTWANNGQTYTTSGTYTGSTTNCVTEELVLTITPSSTNTSTVSACDTYTWANNGQTYTTSGTYTGTTTNCVTEELVLTITPSSTNTTTVTECNAYTWANNGQTYTASGTYTGTTTNCVTEELVLTITPGAFNTTTITACDTYTWANNGQTYTTSGTYTGTTTACVTEQLVLTITPSSTNTTTASACDTYTWANNGQTYTASGTYTGTTTNCVTEELVLTITPSSTNTTTVTACDTYTWAANGQTYTTSGTYTGATVNCVTEELVLTINASPTTTDTVTACGSYTWAVNGQTYTTSGTYTHVIPSTATPAACPAGSTTNGCSTGDEYINNVTFGTTINNNSTCGTTGNYQDFTSISEAVVAGSAYPISISNANTFSSDQARAWADWNHDGDFDDVDETYLLTYAQVTTGSIAVPAGAFNGATRLRVRVTWSGPVPSCGNVQYGEVEDYTLNVSGGVDGPVACPTNATLVLTINPTPAGDTFATAIDANGLTFATTGNNLAANCYTNTIGNASPDVWYRVTLEDCAGSLTVDTSGANTNFDTFVRVYAADGTTQLGFDDDGGTGAASLAVVDVSAHDVVYVVVEGFTTNTGTYDLSLSQTILSIVPTFTQVDPICSGGSFTLATTSDNGITGTWAPAIDNSATTTYTFTPDAGQCTDPTLTTMTVVVNPSSTNTTTISACDTYTWANNGQTYTTSGTYTGTTTNCVTEELVLTITPSSTNTTTVSACDTYTWANNGQTYTTSGTYTGTTTNCVTEELVLTITPSSTNTSTVSACDTYTWANNGQTYTTSGTYTGTTTNCVTEELVLTITPSSFNTTTETACDSYTWAATGQTYTTSGTYTGATVNCVTDQLVLTINNSTTNGSLTTSAVNSYTWNGPLGSGLTYTTSGVYTFTTTNAAGCPNVATLNLTITTGVVTVNTFNIGTSCGATISNLAVTIIAAAVPGATTYTFRITNMNTNVPLVVNRPVNSFALSSYAGITLGTPYQIEVSVNGGANYGAPCIVNTPTPTSTIGAQCGTTLTSMGQFVYATYASTVTGYRFRVTNLSTSAVQVYDALAGQNRFTFNQLSAAIRAFGTTYSVEVALRNTDGSYLPYGASCDITTPAFPTSEVVLSQCDTVATSNTQTINAVVVSGATEYRFQLVNSGLPYSFSIDRPINNFNLSMFPGLQSGTTYTVRVAVRIGGVWGPLTGKPCNITTPGVAAGGTREIADNFVAVAYPNPFAENFMFNVTTTAESTIQIRVYDMLGKQVENRNVEVNAIDSLQVGDSYPSGVYNVIVSQGANTQTLRVIKR